MIMSMKNSPEWKWHGWHMPPGGLKKYCGFFISESVALEWKRKQDKPEEYRVTNFGPLDLARAKDNAASANVRRAPATVTVTEEMKQARAEANRKAREDEAKRREKRRKDDERRKQDAAELATIREDAAGLIDKHKADEQADLEAGINR